MLLSGEEIKTLRKNSGLSQIDLAKKIGITNVYLNKIENDKVAGTLTRLKIKQFFDELIEIPTLS